MKRSSAAKYQPPPPSLTPEHPDAFKDFPPLAAEPPEHMKGYERCPTCKGHGGWNLRLGERPHHGLIAGGLPFLDTPEYFHKYAHHKCWCGACWGWGWIPILVREKMTTARAMTPPSNRRVSPSPAPGELPGVGARVVELKLMLEHKGLNPESRKPREPVYISARDYE